MEQADVAANALLFVMSVFIVLTNGCVCVLVYRRRALRSFTNRFVVSLAVADILTGAVLLPLFVAVPSFKGNGYFYCIILLAGVCNVCAVTYDRYIAVAISLRYIPHISKYSPGIIAASWILPLLISLIPLAWDETDRAQVIYLFVLQFGFVVVPYVFVFVAYVRIFRAVRVCIKRERSLSICSTTQPNKNLTSTFAEAKVARVFAVVAVSFILSWLPVLYMTSVGAFGLENLIPSPLPTISIITMAAGCLVNPIVYSFMKPDFRKVVRQLLRKLKGERNPWRPVPPRMSTKGSESEPIQVTVV